MIKMWEYKRKKTEDEVTKCGRECAREREQESEGKRGVVDTHTHTHLSQAKQSKTDIHTYGKIGNKCRESVREEVGGQDRERLARTKTT